uniref:Uncharacterized protein n=1 Tax=Anguilla anguilla TaxID=7936 RepID=A0A0E9SDJ6_ANGAN
MDLFLMVLHTVVSFLSTVGTMTRPLLVLFKVTPTSEGFFTRLSI